MNSASVVVVVGLLTITAAGWALTENSQNHGCMPWGLVLC